MKKIVYIVIALVLMGFVINYFLYQENHSEIVQNNEPIQLQKTEQKLGDKEHAVLQEKDEQASAEEDLANLLPPLEDVYVPPTPISAEEKAEQEKFEKLGHFIPVEYYNYGLDVLKSLANNGDAYAAFHLGERYYYDLLNDPNHPDYNEKIDYKAEARKSFSNALYHGNRHAAAVISELNMIEEKPEEAFKWHLIAEDLGDTPATEWFKKQEFYQSITEEQKEKARLEYQKLKQELKDKWVNDGQVSLL
ncbi:hypothetical protein [Aliikangiella sp. IMCC44359]|uniref:hypothetical protein n=1 Tax=Aliikangiella sp. IMCC44359 TaxID=3459125 RepID=UPI00403AB632